MKDSTRSRVAIQERLDRRTTEILRDLRTELQYGAEGGLDAHWFVPELLAGCGEIVALCQALEAARLAEDSANLSALDELDEPIPYELTRQEGTA